jgi:hypothetical protein
MAAYTAIDALEKYFASEGPGASWRVPVATTVGLSVEQV